ncbi:alpha carbonic anhydrase 7-like isoform X1 [Nymphaea colorata]|uniref:alpha carbonic anhydrase 7-like isoform X1 n=1 Tax=Nymphaea colorata TaxID=210225 RepID=UPI00214ED69C|nr:alpha carbonic anhydrase 7-like isoform X1 [Nymphaea colorata]
MSTKATILLFALISFLLCSCSNSSEVDDEKEFDYKEGSSKGPEHWSEIHPEWAACRGKEQSPIDLLSKRVVVLPQLGRLKRKYKPARAVLKNRGHDIMLQWVGEAGGIYIKGVKYELKQCHWHSPSEHSINGSRYQLELHMVHESREGGVAVVGILYKLGRPDSFLAKLMHAISKVDPTEEEEIGVVNPKDIRIGTRNYYRYKGSLTTPPCTEGVIWTIVKKVRTASRRQIHALREAVHDGFEVNARPTQGINGRPILLYKPKCI